MDSLTSGLNQPSISVADENGHEGYNEDDEDPLIPKDSEDHHGCATTGEMSNTKFIIITAGILISGFLIALTVDELEVGELACSSVRRLLLKLRSRSARLRRFDWIHDNLLHSPRLLLLPSFPQRSRSDEMARTGTGHIRVDYHGLLVGCSYQKSWSVLMICIQLDLQHH